MSVTMKPKPIWVNKCSTKRDLIEKKEKKRKKSILSLMRILTRVRFTDLCGFLDLMR